MNTTSILDRTYRLLDECPHTKEHIAREAGVGFHWLCKFKQRASKNPGVLHVERLCHWLEADAEARSKIPESSAA